MTPAPPISFRLPPDALAAKADAFNQRREIVWFGLEGRFIEPGVATVRFLSVAEGALGGGGVDAINGGVAAAGFDAVAVLTGLGHYEADTVVTVTLDVQFLTLARIGPALRYEGWATRSGRDGSPSCKACSGTTRRSMRPPTRWWRRRAEFRARRFLSSAPRASSGT